MEVRLQDNLEDLVVVLQIQQGLVAEYPDKDFLVV
jgi:hypothetical protein